MKGRAIAYSADEMAWLEANRLLPIGDYHRRFAAKFDRDVDPKNLHALRKRKGWRTGRTGQFTKGQAPVNKGKKCPPGTGGRHPNAQRSHFKKGGLPHNTRWLGHERVSKDGYVEISIAEQNPHTGYERRYVLKHKHLWEAANGPVPDGMCLKALDGDRTNTDPANWELIPRALLPRLGGRYGREFDAAPPEVKPTILASARLAQRAADLRQRTTKQP